MNVEWRPNEAGTFYSLGDIHRTQVSIIENLSQFIVDRAAEEKHNQGRIDLGGYALGALHGILNGFAFRGTMDHPHTLSDIQHAARYCEALIRDTMGATVPDDHTYKFDRMLPSD